VIKGAWGCLPAGRQGGEVFYESNTISFPKFQASTAHTLPHYANKT
jgi:hypothetical protein